ncbi:NUDIX domain-containing protein [Parasphingorhabdus pacifica]
MTRVLLVHPGGPYWQGKDLGAWSIPKGEHPQGEDPREAALREFREETGTRLPADGLIPLGEISQRSGKVVAAWALEGEFDVSTLSSNTFEIQWPPRSGKTASFPEVDEARWWDLESAGERINPAQAEFLQRLHLLLRDR